METERPWSHWNDLRTYGSSLGRYHRRVFVPDGATHNVLTVANRTFGDFGENAFYDAVLVVEGSAGGSSFSYVYGEATAGDIILTPIVPAAFGVDFQVSADSMGLDVVNSSGASVIVKYSLLRKV